MLCISGFIIFQAAAQKNEANLNFEENGTPYNDITPWHRTSFEKTKSHHISLDSVVKHSGRYSLRIAYDTSGKNTSDGTVVNSFPFDVIGEKIRATAYVKQSGTADTATILSFVLSGDLGEKKITYKGFAVSGAQQWKQYSWEFNLDTFNLTLHHIRITAFPKAKDTVWMDDFNIEVDGKNMYSMPSLASAKGEVIQQLSAQQITGLQMLAYVWGFLKYYHPQVAAGKYNWDFELFKKIPQVKNAANNQQLSQLLHQWIDSLGEIPPCKNCSSKPARNSFTANIDLQWMDSNNISKELQQKLKYILANRHTGNGYYARYEPVQNLLFTNENEYNWREKNYPNELFRLQFLFRYWNTIQYFFPYKNVIGTNWNKVLKDFIPEVAEAKDSIEYHIAINRLVNSVNDSHAGAYDGILSEAFCAVLLPVQTKIINDQAVVSGYFNDSLAKANGLMIGDAITRINNKTIKQIIDDRISWVSGSNYPRKLLSLNIFNYITGGKDSVVELAYTRNDKNYTATVKRYRYEELKYQYKQDKTSFKILDNNIGYVNMGLLERKQVDSMMATLKNTKAIVFDIRNYPRETMGRICEYLKTRYTPFAKIIYPDLNYPGNFRWVESKITVGSSSSTKGIFHYTGKVVLLVNEYTQSQAEWTTMALQTVNGAITIGSQTSGADGNVSTLKLTGNYQTYMTGLGIFYPDGTPTQRTGVKLDIVVKPTVRGIKEGKDEVLEKALDVINKR